MPVTYAKNSANRSWNQPRHCSSVYAASRSYVDANAHPDLAGLRRFVLATSDAHQVYADCGFTPLTDPERFMEIKRSLSELYATE